jgi:hypothetical protein
MAATLPTRKIKYPTKACAIVPSIWIERVSKYFWFLLSFMLFIALGPFSGPIALIAIYKLGLEGNECVGPDSIAWRS